MAHKAYTSVVNNRSVGGFSPNASFSYNEEDEERKRQQQQMQQRIQNASLSTDTARDNYRRYVSEIDALHNPMNSFRIGAQAKAKAQKDYRASVLDDLEKKKTGKVMPIDVQESKARVKSLDNNTRKLLEEYMNPQAKGGISSANGLYNTANDLTKDSRENARMKLLESGMDDKTINAYANDIKKSKDFDAGKSKGGFLTPQEEITLSQAKLDKISNDERTLLRSITKANRNLVEDNINGVIGGTDYNASKNDARNKLKNDYEWDDAKIKEYTLMQKGIDDYYAQMEMNQSVAINPNDSVKDKIGKSIRNSATSLFVAPMAGASGLLSNLEDRPEGYGRNIYSPFNNLNNISEEAQSQVVNNAIGDNHKIGQFLYQTGMSTAQSAELALMGGALGAWGEVATLGAMSAQAYDSSYKEARNRGLSEAQAQEYAIAAGAIEAGTEKLSLDHLWDMAKGTKVGKNLVAQWLAQGGIEASEEAASTIANRISDYYIAGKDGNNEMSLAIKDYMDNGMDEASAKKQAEIDFWKQVGMDALGGGLSGLTMGLGGAYAGVQNAKRNERSSENISEHFKNVSENTNEDTEYSKSVKEKANQYMKNPTQFIADNIDDSTKEGREAKKTLQEYADKVEQGGKLSVSDRNDIEQSIYVAEMAAQKSDESMTARRNYEDYIQSVESVPEQYRSKVSSATLDQVYEGFQEGAKNGDIRKLAETYQAGKNSSSAETRAQVDEMYEQVFGRAESNGLTREQLEVAKVSPQDAYIMAMNGESRENIGTLTSESAEAFIEGEKQKLLTESNVKDSIMKAGEQGISFETAMRDTRNRYVARTLGEDTLREIYDQGVAKATEEFRQGASRDIAKEFGNVGTGTFEDLRKNKSSDIDTEVMRMVSIATKYNVRLVDDTKGMEQASIDLKNSTITVSSKNAKAFFHELGEFTQAWNREGYEEIRKALVDVGSKALGTEKFSKWNEGYRNAYKKAGQDQSSYEITNEMSNDLLVSMMSTDKGQKALSDYLVNNYAETEAKTMKDRIVELFNKLKDSIKSLFGKGKLTDFQQEVLNKSQSELENMVDNFIKEFDKAIQNARGTQGTTGTAKEGTAYSIEVNSEGDELSEQQKEFFAESKIVDENGALKVMYHGTANYGFDVFDIKKAKPGLYGRGFYFADEAIADTYGDTYQVYLNITNPLKPGSKTISKSEMLNFIKAIANDDDYGIDNYGYGATPQSVLKEVWGKDDFSMLQDINASCVGDFCDTVKIFNRTTGNSFDGIDAVDQTIAFYPNQIKEITNKKPTNDDSIKFSVNVDKMLKEIPEGMNPAEGVTQDKDLIAVHNLSLENLDATLDLKGFASPSIAIIRSGMEHSKYGTVSILFNKDTIDPKKNKKNKVYGGDAYTPTFPRVEVKLNEKVANQINKRINDLIPTDVKKAFRNLGLDATNLEDKINRSNGNPVDAYENSEGLKYAFLKENGTELKPQSKESRLNSRFTNEQILAIAEFIDAETAEKLAHGNFNEYKNNKDILEKMRVALNEQFASKYDNNEKELYEKDKFGFADYSNLANGLLEYYTNGITSEADPTSLRTLVNEEIEKGDNAKKYREWLADLFDGVIAKSGLRNNKEVFTNTGNRRSWEALHDDYTLENIVKIMNQNDSVGADAFFSESAIQALALKEFKSVDDIRANKDMLRTETEEEHEQRIQEHSSRLNEIVNEIMDKSERNQFMAHERAVEAIADAVRTSKTAKGIDKVLREYPSLTVHDDTAQEIVDLMKDISNMPTGYFEAKPKRAVWLSEISKVILPSNASDKLINKLERNRVPYEIYEAGDEVARTQLLNDDSVKFSLKVGDNVPFDLNENGGLDHNYSYDYLVSKSDIPAYSAKYFEFETFSDAKEDRENLSGDDVRKLVQNNIAKFNKFRDRNLGEKVVYNKDLKQNIFASNSGIRHGLERIKNLNLEVYENFPAWIENAFVANECLRNGKYSYVMFGVYINKNNEPAIGRAIVTRESYVTEIEDTHLVLKGMKAKKEAAVDSSTQDPAESHNSLATSTYKVSDVLDLVKDKYPDQLSLDVLNHYGLERNEKQEIQGLLYSIEVDDIIFDLLDADSENYVGNASILEEGMKALKNQKVDKNVVNNIATKLKKEYGSEINTKEFSDNIEKAFAFMQTESHINYQDMMNIMEEIARPAIEQSNNSTEEQKQMYEDIKNALKGYSIRLTEAQMEEVKYVYGSYSNFVRHMMPVRISKSGNVTLDEVWSELVEATNYALPEGAIEGDQATALYDVFNSLRPTANQYAGETQEDSARNLAMRIIEEYLTSQGTEESRKAASQMKQKSKEYRQQVRDRYEQRLKEAKQELRAQYQGRISEQKARQIEQIADIRAKSKEKAKVAKEKKAIKHEKERITKVARDLIKWIASPSEKNHVPKDMVAPVTEFLNALDFVEPEVKFTDGKYSAKIYSHMTTDADGKRQLHFNTIVGNTREEVLNKFYEALGRGEGSQYQKKWQDRMSQVRDIFEKVKSGDQFEGEGMDVFLYTIDPDLADEFTDMLSRNRNVANINQLGLDDMKTVKKALVGIAHAIRQQNKAFTINEEISLLGMDTISEGTKIANKDKTNNLANKTKQLLRLDMATPETYFTLMGDGAKKIYKSLREGLNTKIRDIRDAQEYMEGVMKGVEKKDLNKWTGERASYKTFPLLSGEITLTDAQIMSLYELSKREQATGHFAGGIKADVIKHGIKTINKDAKAVHIKPTELKNIIDSLTDEQKRIADAMQKYMATESARQGNETSMRLYGYEKFTEADYFPIRTDRNTNALTNSSAQNTSLRGIEHSGFTKNVKPNATNPIILQDIFDVFTNHITDMAAYHAYAPAINDAVRWFNHKEVTQDGDFETWNTVQDAINKLSGGDGTGYFKKLMLDLNEQEKSQYIGGLFDGLIGNSKAAAVGANIRTVVQQPTAYFRAMNVIDPKYLIASIGNPKSLFAGKKANDLSDIAWWKAQGYYETSIGKSMKEIVTGSQSIMDSVKEKGMWLAGKADDMTWGVLYSAVEKEQRALARGKNLSQEELQARINERFDEVVDQTQVVDSTLHRSQYMRSKDTLNKLQTSFMAEPIKSYNMLMRAIVLDSREKTVKRSMKAVAVFAITNAITSAAAAVVDAFRYDTDDDKWWDVYVEHFIDNLFDNLNPLNLIPVISSTTNSLMNAITGKYSYGSSNNRMDIDPLTNFISFGVELKKYLNKENKKTAYGMYMDASRVLSQATGIPLYNFSRDLSSVYNAFYKDLEKTIKTGKYIGIYDAIKNDKSVGEIKEQVDKYMDNGGVLKDIESGISSRYASDYYEYINSEEEDAKEKADEIAALATKGYLATGNTEKEVEDIIKKWEEKDEGYKPLDTAIETGEGIQDAVKELLEYKKPDKMVEHIMKEYESSVEYDRKNHLSDDIETSVNEALKVIDKTYNYDNTKARLAKLEAEKQAKAEEDAKRAEHRQSVFDAVEKGGDYQKAVRSYYDAGYDMPDLKSKLTTNYVKPAIKAFMNGDASASVTLNRVVAIKAYMDEGMNIEIPKKYNGDYYQYEDDQISDKFKEYEKEPW